MIFSSSEEKRLVSYFVMQFKYKGKYYCHVQYQSQLLKHKASQNSSSWCGTVVGISFDMWASLSV
jgi:hypothetical protein